MPRFQLLVRESNREPRVIPITQLVVVGRSKKAEITIEDDEVGREQFRIGPAGSAVRIEGIGRTNKTTVDGKPLDPGQQVTVPAGATIKVGKTVFVIQLADATDASSLRPGDLDGTMVAGPRAAPRAEPSPEQEATSGGVTPGNTMNMGRPGGGPPPSAAPTMPPRPGSSPGIERTMSPGAYRPGQPPTEPIAPTPFPNVTMPLKPGRSGPAAPPPPPAAADADAIELGMTMPLRPGRPSTPPPAPAAPPPAAKDGFEANLTMPLKPGRAGASGPPPEPAARTSAPAPAPAPMPTPPPPPPPPSPAPAPAAASAAGSNRPKTVMMSPADLAGAATTGGGLPAAELEARLHQCNARIVVKGENVKRRVRLLKVRTKVGRAENADVLLPAESVSEQHAEILFDGTQWLLQDNGSTNGSMVDGTLLRGQRLPIRRDSLVAFGSLRAIFLSNDPAKAAEYRRLDTLALRHLMQSGRLARDVGKQVQELAATDASQSMAELLLLNTPIEAVDWHTAITAARNHVPLLLRLLRRLGLAKKPAP